MCFLLGCHRFKSRRGQCMYTSIDFSSYIVAHRGVPCPTNKGVSYTNLVSRLVVTLKIDYYYYYYYYHKVIKYCLKTLVISNKNTTGLSNSKRLYLHLQFPISRSQGIKPVWKNLITNLLNNKLESTLFTEHCDIKMNYRVITQSTIMQENRNNRYDIGIRV